ncbi:hypothetical protein BDAP_001719 [Binucleata daphniae]
MFPNFDKEYFTYISQNFANLEDLVEYLLLTKSRTEFEISLEDLKYNLKKDNKNLKTSIMSVGYNKSDTECKNDRENKSNIGSNNNVNIFSNVNDNFGSNINNSFSNVKDFSYNYFKNSYKHTYNNDYEYNYPNLFPVKLTKETHDHNYYRNKAQECYKPLIYKSKLENAYYAMKIEENKEKAKYYDYKASEIILSKQCINKKNTMLDFHNLRVNECIDFLEDYIKCLNPSRIEIITGRSTQIKPKVIKYLKDNEFVIEVDRVVSMVFTRKKG